MNAPTLAEIRAWPATVSIPAAAPALGISQSYLYELAARNEAPCRVLKLGTRSRVVVSDLVRLLEAGDHAA